MSSFGINGPSNNQPMVQGSQNLGKDGGGGGNTGYMNMRKKKKGADNEEDNSVFLEEEGQDSFQKESEKKAPPKRRGRFISRFANMMRQKEPIVDSAKDSFEKAPENDFEENEEDYLKYNAPIKKNVDPIEDDEYEIVDDDDYYGNIDV